MFRATAFASAGVLLIALLLMGCGGSSDSADQAANATATPDSASSIPTAYPGVIGVISDFLVIEGSEFFPAIPPCTGFQAEDAEGEVPFTVGKVPEGAREVESIVSTCPDGSLLSATKRYECPTEPPCALSVSYRRAPYSYPVVLGDRRTTQIEALEINGHRGLLIVPVGSRQYWTYAALRFWVAGQDGQKAGAYVEVGTNDVQRTPKDVVALLKEVARSITIEEPAP